MDEPTLHHLTVQFVFQSAERALSVSGTLSKPFAFTYGSLASLRCEIPPG